jgi:hypothetical protein
MRVFLLTVVLALLSGTASATEYLWPHEPSQDGGTLESRIDPPEGFTRVPVEAGTFGAWLRGLPLLPGQPDVLLFNGKKKGNQTAQHAVVNVDVGARDLQQCADAVMRMRAEYLFSSNRKDDICFRMTSGDAHPWSAWAKGRRPRVKGNKVRWAENAASKDATYPNFRRYLSDVFIWAGTWSLSRELEAVEAKSPIQIGDVFIQGGFPGHAVLVVDVAQGKDGTQRFLLAQSYMPAQQFHVLRNPNQEHSPWYSPSQGDELVTPEWTFKWSDRKRFQETGCPPRR